MNATLSRIADYLWSQSWQVAMLVAAIGLVNYLLRNRSAHARYLLWLLVPAKCLVPPVLGITLPILPQAAPPVVPCPPDHPYAGAFETAIVETSVADAAQPSSTAQDPTDPAPGFMSDISIREAMGIAWLAGAGLFAVVAVLKAGRITWWLVRERRTPPARLRSDLRELLPSADVRWMPDVWLIEGIGQPFVWGLFRGEIYLPASFSSMGSHGHQRDILAHELSHVLRCDAAVNLLQVISQALFWFHPLVWWANRRIRAEREKSCDEMAIARLGVQPTDYSRAIVETLLNEHNSLRQVPSLAVAGPVKNIEERIKTMLHPGKKFYRRPSLFATAFVLLLALLIVPTTLALTHVQADPADTQARENSRQGPVETGLDPGAIDVQAQGPAQTNLEIVDVRFEPVHQGKNVVHVVVKNSADKGQVFATHIYTRSPDYGVGGVGWGTPFFETIGSQENRSVRFIFKIQGPVTDRTYVNLRFYNPETRENYDYDRYSEERRYPSSQLPKSQPDAITRKPASTADAQAVIQAFGEIQGLIRQSRYEQAWQQFTEDFQNAEYQARFEWFRRAMEPTHPLHSAFTWEREDLLRLTPREVVRMDGVFALTAALDGQTWTIDFVRQNDLWKIDWIAGYTPKILDIQRQDEQSAAPRAGNNAAAGNLKITGIQLDPVQSGRNTVRFQVQNVSQTDQTFGLDIRTESRDGNWQRQFTKPLEAGQTESMQFDFEIAGSLANASLIRLRFCNPPSPDALDINNWFEQHTYTGEKLGRHDVTYSERQVAQESLPIPQTGDNVKVLDVQFDVVQKGKNVLRVQVQNPTEQDQVFGVSVQARSPGAGGWGTTFLDTIPAGRFRWTRCAFTWKDPTVKEAHVELEFFNPGPAAGFDAEKWFDSKPWDQGFGRHKYFTRDLPYREATDDPLPAASQDQARAARDVLATIQRHVNQKQYEDAWRLFSKDYRDAGFFRRFGMFKECMEPTQGPNRVCWLREEFLELKPESVAVRDDVLVVAGAYEQQKWTIDLVQEEGLWKIDWVAGYVDGWTRQAQWEEYVLPKMEKRGTAHFDIYYPRDSTAAREIDEIAHDKDRGFDEICHLLGGDSDVRIRLVLFEDGRSKQWATGHQGAGWAYGNTIVEIYNEKERLDPYHETTHILTGPLGNPPALFNEGFATYMSEKLGAPALENLGGGKATIHRRAKELKDKGKWIPLTELLGYTEIGSAKSRPPIAYPEAGSFVQFLIETHSKDKFLQAYRTLRNSDQKTMREENIQSLARIYGQPLDSLERQWHDVISQAK
ncbi:MAG: M56 family metallopeptidase [Phycisphaerales bacterium]